MELTRIPKGVFPVEQENSANSAGCLPDGVAWGLDSHETLAE